MNILKCPACGAAIEGGNSNPGQRCSYCGSILSCPSGAATDSSTIAHLFNEEMYEDCRLTCAKALEMNPHNAEARFYFALSELFRETEDYVFIDKTLTLLLIDPDITPIGRNKTVVTNLQTALKQKPELADTLASILTYYYDTRKVPEFYPSRTAQLIVAKIAPRR